MFVRAIGERALRWVLHCHQNRFTWHAKLSSVRSDRVGFPFHSPHLQNVSVNDTMKAFVSRATHREQNSLSQATHGHVMDRTSWRGLLLVAWAMSANGDDDPCDTAATATALLEQPIRLDACTMPFHEEETILSATCIADPHDGAATCLAMRRGWWKAGAPPPIEFAPLPRPLPTVDTSSRV